MEQNQRTKQEPMQELMQKLMQKLMQQPPEQSGQKVTEMPRHQAPLDWSRIQADVAKTGGVIVKSLFSRDQVTSLNQEVDDYLTRKSGLPASGSNQYDKFLGANTVRLHGLIEKTPSAADWIGRKELVDWASESIAPIATSVLLNAAELIQIGPGEPNQYIHRDTDSWPAAAIGGTPLVVNALIALDEFTLENGATRVIPGSWDWDRKRRASDNEILRAEMQPGDALLFRGDILHGGGANLTDKPRRGLSITYCAGWLRPVENSVFNIPRSKASKLPARTQQLLGYHLYDGSSHQGGLLGLYENSDPSVLFG
jgi:ectoine hydroxylase-related dioxygenase (phytanoyl-CoA dioxygenase family)